MASINFYLKKIHMATKNKTKKAVKTVSKKSVSNTDKKSTEKIDCRLSAEQKKQRDRMLSNLENTSDADLKHLIHVYNNSDEEKQERLRIHYEKNGNDYINSIFNGKSKEAEKFAPEKDKKLF